MSRPDRVSFEAVVRPSGGVSMFDDRFAKPSAPSAGRATAAAAELQRLGFRIRHIGTYSISGDGSRELWEQTFQTTLVRQDGVLSHVAGVPFRLPEELSPLVDRAYPQRPPQFFGRVSPAAASPLPPRVSYHHLRVPDDVALVLRAAGVHEQGITGRGVLVAMVDTGFYKHPFYAWHGYHLQATLAPDAVRVDEDAEGHGTAEVANVFAAARDVDLIGVKMGLNPTLAFKTAVDLHPAVITNSWGYDLAGERELPNYLRPLEAAVIEAVEEKGIAVCFSAGNGHTSFPGMLPQVISAGGAYASATVNRHDFDLAASDYASSFDSAIYPGRHVPDVCGLVGLLPRAVYLMLPVQPGNTIDAELAMAFPDGDDTAGTDGWAAISGTSAAAPQLAGVCALLKQARPDLTPAQLKAVLKASARDVTTGHSAMGDEAGRGPDGPTGAGLVDALAAYQMARSLKAA